MSFIEVQYPALTAADLLSCDERKVVQYLERTGGDDGEFDISDLIGVGSLSKSERTELTQRLSAAVLRLRNTTASQPLETDELCARLTSIAEKQDGSQSPGCETLRSPAEFFESTESTPPPFKASDLEAASYYELVEDGGQPVCSIQDLSSFGATARYGGIRPWLTDHPDSEIGDGEIKTVFSRQFTRWWDFRKAQLGSRGIANSEEGISTFLKASRNRWERIGAHAMTSASSFEETIRRQWQQKPVIRLVSDSQGFPAYREAVKRRLAPYHFTRPLQLKKHPYQQTKWTTWLEYINFEKHRSETLNAEADSLIVMHYYQPWKRLLEQCPSMDATPNRYPPTKNSNLAENLEAARADLDRTNTVIEEFIRATALYRRAETSAYYQKLRVEWAVKVARSLETEKLPNRRTKSQANKKRRRADDQEMPPEPWSKRTRQGRQFSGNQARLPK